MEDVAKRLRSEGRIKMPDDVKRPKLPEGLRDGNSQISPLQAELERSLAIGLTPDGWTHEITWEADSPKIHPIPTVAFIFGSTLTCWLFWGWKAGIAATAAAIGLRMLFSVRNGPQPGQEITEWFIPPDEKLFEAGIAGHEIVEITRGRPGFSRTRIATSADRRFTHRVFAAASSALSLGGFLTLLEEASVISPISYLRVQSLLVAAICAFLAIWIWRRIGINMPLLDSKPAAPMGSTIRDVLDSATTGSTAEALPSAVLSRIPPRVNRVLLPALAVVYGTLSVLISFSVTPDRSQLWSGLTAAMELAVFILAGIRAVLLIAVGVIQHDWLAFRSALWTIALMGVLLLVAKLFGWLDDWGAVISWVGDHVG
ncbi:hypothetical protein [Streptomyces sp. NPDC053367]|uniref:hypothetical protein n=1 Tax=Streptomyces sp. NPDC053367 TaxID=3365700 RepID=UPI0037D3C551